MAKLHLQIAIITNQNKDLHKKFGGFFTLSAIFNEYGRIQPPKISNKGYKCAT